MSTIASLISQIDPSAIKPWYEGQQGVNREQIGRQQAQTGLIELQQLKEKQEAEQLFLEQVKNNPDLARQLLGDGSILGSLGTAGAPPGGMPGAPPGPITQGSLGPGGMGGTQTIPAYPDASRYAGVSPQGGGPIPPDVMGQVMPQSTIASLGPQGATGGQPPPPRNPVLEMAATNPRAAMLMQQQMQAQQDRQWKLQEQRLKMGSTMMESLGQMAQGVTDQAGWDQLRQDAAQISPQLAARVEPVYSKEGKARLIAQATGVKDSLTLQMDARKLDVLIRGQDVELAKAQQTGGKVNYEKDAQGNIVVVPEYAPGGAPVQSRPVLGADGQPIKSLEGQKLTAEQQRHLQTVEGGLRTHVDTLLAPLYAARDAIGRVEQSADQPSAAGDLALITAFMQMIDPRTGVKDAEFRNAAASGSLLDRIQGYISKAKDGTPLDEDVRADFLQRARKLYEQYDKDYGGVKQQYRDLTSRMGGNPDNVVLDTGSTVAKTPGASGPKVVTRAALHAEAARRNVSPEQAEALAKQKGYEVR